MKRLGIGLIGCGTISEIHLDVIRRLEQAQLICVCDKDLSVAKSVSQVFECSYTTDYLELLKNQAIEVIHILTPHYLHTPMAIECLKAGKHVVLEKPVGISLEQLEELQQVANAAKVTIGVTLQNRYNNSTLMMKSYIDSGQLGAFKSIRASVIWHRSEAYYSESKWRGQQKYEGGGLLINQAIHTLDLMDYLGGGAHSVRGHVANHSHPNIEVEDTAMATMDFGGGALGTFYGSNCYGDNTNVEIEVLFEKGRLRLLDQSVFLTRDGHTKKVADDLIKEGEKSYWGVSHKQCIKDIYEAILDKRPPLVTLEEAIRATKIVLAIYESSLKDKVVTL